MNLSETFIDGLMAIPQQADERDLAKARACLLDFMGVALGGGAEMRAESSAFAAAIGAEPGPIAVVGSIKRYSLLTAALLQGMHAHKLELDDGHRFGMVHPGATVIAALLPLAQQRALSMRDLLIGIVVGYEAAIRLAMAVQPGMKHRGYHATGTCGAVGASLGAAAALRLPRVQWLSALAAAATQSAGLLEVIRDGSALKPFNAGQAAMHGLVAVAMAEAGFTGPRDVLGGKQGLLSVLTPEAKPDKLHEGSAALAIHGIYVKPYAACRHAHAPVEAALNLRREECIAPEAVAEVRVRTYDLAVHLHDHRHVQSAADAKMSTPYSVAAALCAGQVGMEQFTAAWLGHPELNRIMSVVMVEEDGAMSARVPQERAAEVTVRLRDGREHARLVLLPKGEPENPLSVEELQAKYLDLARAGGLDADRAQRLMHAVLDNDGDAAAVLSRCWE